MIGRKEGRKEARKSKEKREGERDQRLVQSPECEHLTILVTCLSSLEIHSFFFSYNKTNVSLRPNLLSGKFSSEKSVVFWQVPQIVNWIKMNEQCLILLYSYYLQTKAKITKNASQHVSECSQQVYS